MCWAPIITDVFEFEMDNGSESVCSYICTVFEAITWVSPPLMFDTTVFSCRQCLPVAFLR